MNLYKDEKYRGCVIISDGKGKGGDACSHTYINGIWEHSIGRNKKINVNNLKKIIDKKLEQYKEWDLGNFKGYDI